MRPTVQELLLDIVVYMSFVNSKQYFNRQRLPIVWPARNTGIVLSQFTQLSMKAWSWSITGVQKVCCYPITHWSKKKQLKYVQVISNYFPLLSVHTENNNTTGMTINQGFYIIHPHLLRARPKLSPMQERIQDFFQEGCTTTSTPFIYLFFFAKHKLYQKAACHLKEGCAPPAPSPQFRPCCVNGWINNEYWAVIKAHNPQHLLWLSVLDRP